jgi:plastocyanin
VRSSGVPTVTVNRGDVVSWRFVGREPHNVRASKGPRASRRPGAPAPIAGA